ncbi:MAG: ATP-binding protein [Subtercola sp.]|nr:ATP-binding protein [Subtercola sp.]
MHKPHSAAHSSLTASQPASAPASAPAAKPASAPASAPAAKPDSARASAPGAPPPSHHLVARDTTEPVDALLSFIAAAWALSSGPEPRSAATAFTGPVVLIDGRSGSGKTALAEALAEAWPGRAEGATLGATLPTVVHLDDIYPGWHGLELASAHVHDQLLAAAQPRWQRYDWANERATEWASVDKARPLIVEGVGALSRQNAALATITIWLELDDATRRSRAIARDGQTYEPFWNIWAEQEDVFLARESPASLADVIVDFTAS